jgi:hypothetical protein
MVLASYADTSAHIMSSRSTRYAFVAATKRKAWLRTLTSNALFIR